MSASGPITHVSDTARWVALYRAMESERPDALFRDPYARRLAGERGERPVCVLEYAAADLTNAAERRALFARVGAATRAALVISEGLLVYLTAEQVRGLATELHGQPSFRWWLIDLASPALLKMMERTWGQAVAAGNAPFQFAPAEGTQFFEASGWREAEYRSTWDESLRLKRSMRFARLWTLVGRFAPKRRRDEWRRFSGIVLLERG